MSSSLWRSEGSRSVVDVVGKSHLTTLSSLSSLSRLISRMAVLGTPSSSASSLIFLRATISFEVTSRALYTTPYVPGKMMGVTGCQLARIWCSRYLRLWGRMWVEEDKDESD
jgi:hypothetical protein